MVHKSVFLEGNLIIRHQNLLVGMSERCFKGITAINITRRGKDEL